MKSLEIVNDYINLIDNFEFDKCYVGVNELQQIKEDLEVLEILKNKKVDIGFVKSILESCSIEESLEVINDCGYRKLTMEELLKIKQWLEVNEK